MKRILSLLLTLTLVVTFFAFGQAEVKADVPATECTTDKVVVIHYKRWDDDYTNMDFWAWGNGTDGAENNLDGNPQIVGNDDFGAVAYLCIAEDASGEAGLIPRLNDWSYKDGVDLNGDGGDDKSILLRDGAALATVKAEQATLQSMNDDNTATPDTWSQVEIDAQQAIIDAAQDAFNISAFSGFDAVSGEKHVYVLQGSATVYEVDTTMPYFQKDGFGTLVVVYYEATESYDGWNVWNWGAGTDGTAANDTDGAVPFQYDLGVDQTAEAGKYKVAIFNIAADADDNMGFIVRTDSWEKQWADDLNIDITAIKGSGTQFTFYLGGTDSFFDTYTGFDDVINFFEIESAMALDPNSVEVVFNKDVITSVDDVITFDPTMLTLSDKDGTDVVVSQVSFNSTTDVNKTFTLITETALTGAMSPYTVTYTVDGMDPYTKEFDVDSVAPVITVLGPTATTLELGDTYSLPNYFATDEVDGGTVDIYNVRVKDDMGTVDTRNAGVYEVVIEAHDKFGNVAEATITVTVTDPCDATAHLNANSNVGLISLLVGLPIAFGAFITLKRNY